MFKRNILKRAFTIVVAAATVVTTVFPATALAAPDSDGLLLSDAAVSSEEDITVDDETDEVIVDAEDVTAEEVVDGESQSVTYDFSKLKAVDGFGGLGYTVDPDTGAAVFESTAGYQTTFFEIPEDIVGKGITKITVNSTDVPYAGTTKIGAVPDWDDGKLLKVGYGYNFVAVSADEGMKATVFGIMLSDSGKTINATDVTFEFDDSVKPVKKGNYTFDFSKYTGSADKEALVEILKLDPTKIPAGTPADLDGASYEYSGGKLIVTCTKQYGQIFFRLPEETDDMVISSAEWIPTEGSNTQGLCCKLLTVDDFTGANNNNRGGDVGCNWNGPKTSASSAELGLACRYVAFMCMSPNATVEEPQVYSFDCVNIEYTPFERIIKEANMIKAEDSNFEVESLDDIFWYDCSGSKEHLEIGEYEADEALNDACGSQYLYSAHYGEAGYGEKLEYFQALELIPGDHYEFSVLIKSDEPESGATADVKLSISDVDVKPIKVDNPVSLADGWTTASGEFIVPASDADYVSGVLSIEAKNVNGFAIDKVVFAHKTVPHVQKDIPNFYEEIAKQGIEYSGVCLPSSIFAEGNEMQLELAFKHFNSITCENEMKPDSILGSKPVIGEDGYPVLNFATPDSMAQTIVDYNKANGTNIKMRGHVFVWHSQTPSWFFRKNFDSAADYVDKKEMNKRIEWYIKTVGEHFDTKFPGLIYAWDVVNEQADDNGGIRMGSDWANIYKGSSEYITNAFIYADKYVAKDTILCYNDYNECNGTKCDTICGFLRDIKKNVSPERKIGAGMQSHHDMATPTNAQIEEAVRKYAEIADVINVTELDVKSTMGFDGKDLDTEFNSQAWRYYDIYQILEKVNAEYENKKVQGVTIWGLYDTISWLKTSNNVGGSADGKTPQYPLLFDDNLQAKPAYWALIEGTDGLLPRINQVEVVQVADVDPYKYGKEYNVHIEEEGEVLDYSFIPVWDNNGVDIKVSINSLPAIIDQDFGEIGGFFSTSRELENTYVEATEITAKKEYVIHKDFDESFNKTNGKFLFDIAILFGDGGWVAYNDYTAQAAPWAEKSSQFLAEAIFKPFLAIGSGTPEIDGEFDAVWDNVDPVDLSIKVSDGGGVPKATAQVGFLWDYDYLYALAVVTDEVLDSTGTGGDHTKDSFEVFIDENNAKSGSYQEDDKQYRINIENEATFKGDKCNEDNCLHVVKKTDNGYVVEAAYKWTDISPAVGSMIGIETQINDCEGGKRLGTVSWFDQTGNGWQNPSVFGTAILTNGVDNASEFYVQPISDYTYTGSAICPKVCVKNNNTLLKAGTDYTVSYKNNINVASKEAEAAPTVVITGKGAYEGSVEAKFSILKADIADVEFSVKELVNATDKELVNAPTSVTFNGKKVDASHYAVKYVLSDESVVDAVPAEYRGYVSVKLVAAENSSFVGETECAEFQVIGKDQVIADTLTVTLPKSVAFTGEAITFTDKQLVVKAGKKVLKAGDDDNADYKVSYENNVDVGTATVTITGNGTVNPEAGVVIGTVSKTFEITGTPVSKLKITLPKSVYYTGEAIDLVSQLSVKDGKKAVSDLTDKHFEIGAPIESGYTVSVTNNTEIGTASVIISGLGKYTGVVTKNVEIIGFDLGKAAVKATAHTFDGTAFVPEATVTYTVKDNAQAEILTAKGYTAANGKALKKGSKITLTAGKDFEVETVSGGTDAGKAVYAVNGKQYFSGTKKFNVTIAKAPIKDASVAEIDAVTYDKTAQKPEIGATYKTMSLVAGTDFTAAYAKNVNAGTAKVTLKGKGNYTGSTVVNFTINPAVISDYFEATATDVLVAKGFKKTKVTVKDANGKAAKVNKDYEKAIKYMVDGVEATDVKAGTVVTAVVTGKGNYTGTISADYLVAKADLSKAKIVVKDDVKYAYTGKAVEVNEGDLLVYFGKDKANALTVDDFEVVSYADTHTTVGTHKFTIQGTAVEGSENCYIGTATGKFTIGKKSFSIISSIQNFFGNLF